MYDKCAAISFSLYGNINKYVGGLLQNCKDINQLYPNFWIYVYIGSEVDFSLYNSKFQGVYNIKFIKTGCSGHMNMVQRFLTIDCEEVGVAFSRDADSRINKRDQYCINEFLKSDKKFQIIRDNIQHNTHILGGMWGVKKGLLKHSMKELLTNYTGNKVGDDQIFLQKTIYPLVIHDAIIFDEFFNYPNEIPQKINVDYYEVFGKRDFVGNSFMPKNLNDPFGEHGEWYPI